MDDAVEEVGPIDYIAVEWPGKQPTGEAVPHLVDLVDRGLIRILDLAFITKGEDARWPPWRSPRSPSRWSR